MAQISFDPTAHVTGYFVFEEPVKVGESCKISRSEMGAFSYLSRGTEIVSSRLGRYCSVGPRTIIGPGNHPTSRLTTSAVTFGDEFREFSDNASLKTPFRLKTSEVIIGHDVWIGANCVIMNGVLVGDGSVIGAGAVVTKDVPPYAIVAGVPAKVIRYRFNPDIVRRLQSLEWWNYDLAQWAIRGDMPKITEITNYTVDKLEEIIRQNPPPLMSGKKIRVDFDAAGKATEKVLHELSEVQLSRLRSAGVQDSRPANDDKLPPTRAESYDRKRTVVEIEYGVSNDSN